MTSTDPRRVGTVRHRRHRTPLERLSSWVTADSHPRLAAFLGALVAFLGGVMVGTQLEMWSR